MSDIEVAALGGVVVGAIGTVFAGIYFAYYIFRIIAEYKIFTKAGEKGWKSFIPVYNVYTECKLTSKKSLFVPYIVLTFAAAFIQEYAGTSNIVDILSTVVNIAVTVVTYLRWKKLAGAYGKGTGFAIGLLLLNPIFIMILGLGKATYQGPVED